MCWGTLILSVPIFIRRVLKMEQLKKQLFDYIEGHHEKYEEIAREIFNHPETSDQEYFASGILSQVLRENDFEVTQDVAGHPTGFTAVKKSGKSGPVLAFLAEYDALAGLGHGCGHHLIGTISVLSAIALSKLLDQLGGEIRVYGTPGEEGGQNGSAKESFVVKGYFKDVDIAMQLHPADVNALTPRSLALDPVDIEFFGKAAHAGAAPEEGINALDALILTYNGINALRQHLTSDIKIHGIILEGGTAPNTIPDYTRGRFYLRGNTRGQVNQVYQKVEKIAEGAALATGCTYKMGRFQNKVDNIIPNEKIDAVYCSALEALGEDWEREASFPSTDAGNVSQVIPLLHPLFKITEEKTALHTEAFLKVCGSDAGIARLTRGSELLAYTGLKLLLEPSLVAEIKTAHLNLIKPLHHQ